MPKIAHYIIIALCVALIIFLYNKQLASIPFIILSLYLFYFAWKEFGKRNKKSR